jgi:WD40 repeat protein
MKPIDPAKTKLRTAYAHPATFYGLSVDPISGRVYSGADDSAIYMFDPTSKAQQPITRWTKHDNYVSALVGVRRKSQHLLVSGSYDRHLIWWDTAAGKAVRTVEAHQGWIRDLAALPDGSRLASVGDDMLLKVWETETGRLVRTFTGHATRTPQGHVTALYAVAVSPDGKFLASGDRIGEVRIWEADTGKLAQSLQVPILYTYDPRQRKRSLGGIRALAFSPNGKHLAVGGMGQVENVDGLGGLVHVELWDWRKGEQCFAAGALGHKGMINQLQFDSSGTWLLGGGGGSDNGFLAFWKTDSLPVSKDKKDAVPVQRIKADGHLHRLWLDSGKNELYTAGYRKLEIWTLST